MDTKALKEILKEKSVSFSQKELKNIIDEELEKSEEEMDVELIDQCLDLLEGSSDNNFKEKNTRKIKIKKILLIAAIVALILCIAVPVGAKFLSIDTSDNVVEYQKDHFKINMSEENLNNTLNIETVKQQINFDNMILPTGLFKGDYVLSDLYNEKIDDSIEETSFCAETEQFNCMINISKYYNTEGLENIIGKFIVPNNFQYFKQLKINSIDVLVYSDDVNSAIYYYSENCEYQIALSDCKFNTAVSLAETLSYL